MAPFTEKNEPIKSIEKKNVDAKSSHLNIK